MKDRVLLAATSMIGFMAGEIASLLISRRAVGRPSTRSWPAP
jgi:hypothetical protein